MAFKAGQQSAGDIHPAYGFTSTDDLETVHSTIFLPYYSDTCFRQVCERFGNGREITATHEPTCSVTT
jgi:hypothetical protein